MARTSNDPIERLLARRLSPDAAAAGEVCPDPELLAAFVDGALQRDERDGIERHAASCSQCAQILSAAVASEPPASQPDRAAIWPGWRTLRWAVPAVTAVIVGGVWFVAPGGRPASVLAPEREASETAAARSQPPEVVTRDLEMRETERPAAPQQAAPAIESFEVKRRADAPELADPSRPSAATSSLSDPQRRDAAADATKLEKSAAKAQTSQTAASADTRAPAEVALNDPGPQARKESAAAALAREPDRGGAGARSREADVAVALVRTSNPNIVWRSRGASIERSTNGGETWTVERTAPGPLAGGAAAAPDVVWFFARGGLILRHVQGKWIQSNAPAGATVISLQAVTAARATIALADGRVLDTSDGGLSWNAR